MGQQQAKLNLDHLRESLEKSIFPPNSKFWDELFSVGADLVSLYEIHFRVFTKLLSSNPVNVAVLFYQLVDDIHKLSKETPVPSGPLMCRVRFLARVLPAVLASEDVTLCQKLFWTAGPLDTSMLIPQNQQSQNSGVSNQHFVLQSPDQGQSLAVSICIELCNLLFLPEYTIAPNTNNNSSDLQNSWARGIGTSTVNPSTQLMMMNRIEVIRAILACLSSPLYSPPGENPKQDQWQAAFADQTINSNGELMFFSFINTGLGYDPVGWGIPYNYLLSADIHEPLAELSLQVLIALLTCGSSENLFGNLLRSIEEESEFDFLFSALSTLLNNPFTSRNTYLPSSRKQLDSYQEHMILVWFLISENPKFLQYLVNHKDLTEWVTPLLFHMLEHRRDEGLAGFVHLAAFILLVFSGERKFGIRLNKPFVHPRFSSDLPVFRGTFNDFIILVLHKLIVNSHPCLDSLKECLFTIITNLSPYAGSLCMTTALKLTKLFAQIAAPANLLSYQPYHRYVQFLLDTFNNLIQYQYAGNHAIVYGILREYKSFRQISNLRIRTSRSPSQSENPHEWIPTDEWLQNWKAQLPLSTCLRLINELLRDLDASNKLTDSAQIMEYLKTITLVGLLPVPHPILIRKYQKNAATDLWFQRYVWSVLVVRNRAPPLFGGSSVKLFQVKSSQ